MTQYHLTPSKLLILAAIRRLQPCGPTALADFLDKPISTISNEIYGSKSNHTTRSYSYSGLIETGHIAQAHPPIHSVPLRLTEAGEEAIQDICLIYEDGRYSVGEVIRRYEEEVIRLTNRFD